jgi:hypothetical protein
VTTTEPTLVAYAETAWNTQGTSKSAAAISWQTGDLVVVEALTEDAIATVGVADQLGLTFTAGGGVGTSGSTCWAGDWSATATDDRTSVQVAATCANGSTRSWGIGVWVYRDSDGVGARAADATTAKTVSLSRTGDHSHVVGVQGDYSAAATTGYSFTPTVGNDREATRDTGRYTAYAADWADQGTAGSTSYGTTGETSTGTFAKIAREILGHTVLPTDPMPVAYVAAGAYSTSGATTPISLDVPAGVQEKDVLYALILTKPGTATVTATDWVEDYASPSLGGGTVGTGTGPVALHVMKRVVPAGGVSSPVAFTIGNSPNSYMGRMLAYRYDPTGFTDDQWAPPAGCTYSRTTASTAFGGTGDATLDFDPNDVLLFVSLSADDQSTNHDSTSTYVSTIAVPGVTLSGASNVLGTGVTTTGGDSSMFVGRANVDSGTATGAPTVTITGSSSETGGGVFLRIRAVGTAGAATYQASGTIAATTATQGTPAALFGATGTTDATAATQGIPTGRLVAAGTVAASSTVQGDATIVTQGGTVYGASGTAAATATAQGAVSALLAAAGTISALSGCQGTPNARFGATGTIPAAATTQGDAIKVGGAQVYAASGTVAALAATQGTPTGRLALAGTVTVSASAQGAPTGRLAAAGTVAALAVVEGNATLAGLVVATIRRRTFTVPGVRDRFVADRRLDAVATTVRRFTAR